MRLRRGAAQNFSLTIVGGARLGARTGSTQLRRIGGLTHDELATLYSGGDLQSYHPEALLVQTFDAESVPALVYNLPEPPGAEERNAPYAAQLFALLAKLDMPRDYIDSIR